MINKKGLISPNELLEAAKKEMLDDREPSTKDDWELIMNFMAFNIAHEIQPSALQVIAKIYNMPLSEDEIAKISEFQANN